MDGLEPFASTFTIVTQGREVVAIPVTPELYAKLKGPYNRRNVYGAVFAAGPRLPEAIWRSVLQYGFAPAGPLRQDLGLPEDTTKIRLRIRTNTRGRSGSWELPCTN